MILPAQRKQQRGLKLLLLHLRGDLAGETLLEDRLNLGICCGYIGHSLQAVIGDPAAQRDEERKPLLERLLKLCKALDVPQAFQVFQIIRLLNAQRLVRAVGGQNLHVKGRIPGKLFVPFQAVRRIVGGTERFDV